MEVLNRLPTQDEVQAGRHVLGFYSYPGGHRPGSFTENLLRTFECADFVNTHKLWTAYPDYKGPLVIMKNLGAEALKKWLENEVEGND